MSFKDTDLFKVIQAPILTEKSAFGTDSEKHYIFRVDKRANKIQIKKSVEMAFDVKIASVKVLNVKGKAKRFSGRLGKRSDWKKAYIKLVSGYDIELSAN